MASLLIFFIISTISIAQFAKLSLDKPFDPRGFNSNRLNDFREIDKIRKEVIINELWSITIINFLFIYLFLGLIIWNGTYFILKPINDSIKDKEKFLENSSHELRTPLAILSSDLQLTLIDDNIESIKKSNIESLIEIERLQNLSNTLLSSFNPIINNVNMNDLIGKILKRFERININSNTFSLSGTELIVNSNEDKLYNIIFNLIDNGCKYSTPNSSIVILVAGKTIEIINQTNSEFFEQGTGLKLVNQLSTDLSINYNTNLAKNIFTSKLIFE